VAGVLGLKVVFPATARDAKGLLAAALAGNDPVIFFESQRLYDVPETVLPRGSVGVVRDPHWSAQRGSRRYGPLDTDGRRCAAPSTRGRHSAGTAVRLDGWSACRTRTFVAAG
jgi:Transketolase, pyrimidine binding domain